jgi:hypothetical protein
MASWNANSDSASLQSPFVLKPRQRFHCIDPSPSTQAQGRLSCRVAESSWSHPLKFPPSSLVLDQRTISSTPLPTVSLRSAASSLIRPQPAHTEAKAARITRNSHFASVYVYFTVLVVKIKGKEHKHESELQCRVVSLGQYADVSQN